MKKLSVWGRRRIAYLLIPLAFLFVWKSISSMKSDEQEMVGNFFTEEIKLENLRETILDLESLGERASWEGQKRASVYLKQRLEDMDLEPEIQTYFHKDKTWENVIMIFPGSVNAEETLLAVAHYDSKNWTIPSDSPGADDNGTGVAALLEIARILQHRTHQSSVILVFSSNEEYGRAGSKYFAKQAKEKGIDISGVLNVDTVGYNRPWALFSREPFHALFDSRFSVSRKAKIIAKLGYNWVMSFWFGSKSLKVVGRHEESRLIPADLNARQTIGGNRIRWIIGDRGT